MRIEAVGYAPPAWPIEPIHKVEPRNKTFVQPIQIVPSYHVDSMSSMAGQNDVTTHAYRDSRSSVAFTTIQKKPETEAIFAKNKEHDKLDQQIKASRIQNHLQPANIAMYS